MVGRVNLTQGAIIPTAVDIGCGMMAVQRALNASHMIKMKDEGEG